MASDLERKHQNPESSGFSSYDMFIALIKQDNLINSSGTFRYLWEKAGGSIVYISHPQLDKSDIINIAVWLDRDDNIALEEVKHKDTVQDPWASMTGTNEYAVHEWYTYHTYGEEFTSNENQARINTLIQNSLESITSKK